MNKQLIKELIADAREENIGLRMRAVIDAVVSAAAYAYTAGLIAADKWAAFVLWYEQVWVGQMKRQAVAAEYNSGRNMEAWYREVSLTSDAGRQLLGEARKLELTDVSTGHSDAPQLSQALPTRHAVLEYAKAELLGPDRNDRS